LGDAASLCPLYHHRAGGLGLEDEIFDFSPAAVLFGELDAKLPAVIRGSQE